MSSLAKAALLSVVVFLAILGVSLLFLHKGNKPQDLARTQAVEDEGLQEARVEPRGTEFDRTAPPAPRETVKLTVEVLEKGRNRRLQGSRVMALQAIDGDRPGKRVWESDRTTTGFFEIPLEPGAYLVRVQCPRYKGESRTVTLLKGAPQNLVFELGRGNSISGRILAAGGGPIGGARVLALMDFAGPGADLEEHLVALIGIQERTNEIAAETVSAADGTYQLDGLDFKHYTVRAVAAGHAAGELEGIPAPRAEVDVVLEKTGRVGGIVREAGGSPVGDAEVMAYKELDTQNVFEIIAAKARPPIDTARSDSSGSFAFETLGSGLYNFLIQAKGYQRAQQVKVRVGPGGSNSLAFTLKPGFTLSGIVRGPNDEPVSGARVRATVTGAAAVGRKDQVNISFDDESIATNDQGEFRFDTLEEGTFMVLCWHPDYQTGQRNDVHVRAGSDELNIKLSHGGRLKGIVKDAVSDRPVSGAKVSANDRADLHKDAVTQEDGTFILSGLSPGSRPVSVTVTSEGFARVRRDVRIEENREVEETFVLQATGSVSGRVVNSNGDAIRGARVMAKRTQETGVETTLSTDVTDAEGNYTLKDIEAGDGNRLRVKKGEFLDTLTDTFSVAPLESVEMPLVVLQLGGAISGRVLGTGGRGISGCVVTLAHEGDTEINLASNPSSSTNTHGEFLIQGLPAGVVDLVVKAPHYLETRKSGIEVREGEKHGNIDIQLEQGQSVSGRVVDARGQPVANADVLASDYAQGAKQIRTVSGSDGAFIVEGILATDSVELEVAHDNFARYSNAQVRVGTTLEVVLKELGSLQGVVITADGNPIEAFTIQAQNPASTRDPRKGPKSQTINSADGSFIYRGVPAGTFTVFVNAPLYSAATIPDVMVFEGQTVDLGAIVLQPGSIVTGSVIDASNQSPIAGARVQIVQGSSRFLKGGDAGANAGGNPIQVTAADGTFRFTNLKSGNLSLKVSNDGYVTEKVDEVNPGVAQKSQDLVIALGRGGEVSGQVLGGDGRPRAGMPVYLIGSETGSNQTRQTDSEGKFRFVGVPSGTFTVKAHKFASGGAGAPEEAETAIELAPGASETVSLQLE
ncbi:MAG TPA: carboxypeptidase-like regulatory domain-containing protein [Planctomycetota bacterium]|nr:carboxypeptidase-like regulatory domain-containing protein [Planctomycetota bacterium]